ncbi:MAG: hypothetical protein OEV81_11420 [Betaproteobacteria bacterium]|nr:hypothetical protein [Betaproteobacteria bacterium]MDH5220325.1 hypothetical protein [Betaproteobacteria bacterium]MDH5349768.1 hypothetical protein [Betaproteobacteria bacterium]
MNVFRLAGAALALALSTQALAVGRIADINVFDRSNGRRLPVYWHAGQAYVVGRPGSEYRIEVRNREGGDLLAVMSVDGVNVITGASAHPAQSGYVIGPRGRLAVDGWRKSLERTAAFYFTALGDSYAARTGRPEDVGVIGVALFRRKAEPPQPFSGIASEPRAAARDSAKAEESLGTGHGRSETSYARHVTFERATPHPAETIAIRYDSYRNLVALGVIRETPRHPRPFPGFVPDA